MKVSVLTATLGVIFSTLAVAAAAQDFRVPAVRAEMLPVQGAVGGVEFPSRDRSYMSKGDKGDFINVDNLRQMKPGLSKQEVRRLLGAPHFSEGLMAVNKWNYIFNFRTGVENAFITCQYQVVYAKTPSYTVDTMHWDSPECLELLNRPAAVAAPQPVAVTPAVPERVINLSADALFRFDKSSDGDMLPKGRAQIQELAPSLVDGSPNIVVIGYTDRMGDEAYNQALSERRAATVRNLLVSLGVSPENIVAEGRGETQPVTNCAENQARSELIACLQPDRRVQIIARGTQPAR